MHPTRGERDVVDGRFATAYATADSKPLPLLGSSSTNHGAYAGLSVPTVSVPGVRVWSEALVQAAADADPVVDDADGADASSASVRTKPR